LNVYWNVVDFKTCLDNFCEDLARSCENLIFVSAQNKTILLTEKPASQLNFFDRLLNFSQQHGQENSNAHSIPSTFLYPPDFS